MLNCNEFAFILYRVMTNYPITKEEYEGDWLRKPERAKQLWINKAKAIIKKLEEVIK